MSIDAVFQFLHKRYFRRIGSRRLKLKPTKSKFLVDHVKIFGNKGLSKLGLRPEPQKLEKISNYPNSTNITELAAFPHLTTYLKMFIPGWADWAKVILDACVYAEDACATGLDTKKKNTTVIKNSSTGNKKPKVIKKLIAFEWESAQRETLQLWKSLSSTM